MSLPWLLLVLYMVDLGYGGQYDNYMVQEHNKFRRMEAKKGAANIEKMVWSNTIANVALNWAKTCTVGHNGKTGYGENLYFHTIRDKGQERDLIERGIKAWYDEYTLWNWSTGFTTPTGHYTQLVWAKSIEVGCGIYTCPPNGQFREKFLYLSCFYNPPGNFNDNGKFRTGDPYIRGRACSKCAAGEQCDDGLCSGSNNGGNVWDNNSNGGETGTDNNVNWWDSNSNGGGTSSNNDNNWWNNNGGNTGGNSWDNNDSENSWDNNGNSGNSWDNSNTENWWDGGQAWDNNGNSGNNNWNSWNSWENNWNGGNSWDSNGNSGDTWDNNWNNDNSWNNNWDNGNSWDSNGNSGNTWDNNWNNDNSWDNNWNNDNSWDNKQNNDNSWNNDWNDGNSWDSSWNGGNDNWWKRGKVVRLKQDGRKDQSDKQFDADRNNERQMNIAKLHHKSLHSADKDALQLHQLRQNDATKSDLRVKKITQRNSTRLHPQIRQLFNRKLIDRQLKPKMKKAQRLSTLKRFVSLVKSLKKGQLKTKQKDDERKQ